MYGKILVGINSNSLFYVLFRGSFASFVKYTSYGILFSSMILIIPKKKELSSQSYAAALKKYKNKNVSVRESVVFS